VNNQDLAAQFAERLNGREYCNEITKDEEAIAKAQNLIVCYGASDNLLEVRGVAYDEFGACDGTTIYMLNGWFVSEPTRDELEVIHKFGLEFEFKFQITIEAIWAPKTIRASWLITVEGAESYPFDIMEDGELFCRGVVFEIEPKLSVAI